MRSKLLRGLLVAVLLNFSSSTIGRADLQTGTKAPPLHGSDWHHTKSIPTINRLRGKITVLAFLKCGDGDCIRAQEQLAKMHEELKENGVVLIGLFEESDSKVLKHVDKYPAPYAIASGSRSRRTYSVPSFPSFAVIDPDSTIAWLGHDAAELRKAIDAAIQKTPPKSNEEMAKIFEEEAYDRLKKADEMYKKKLLSDALDLYKAIADDYPDVASGKKAQRQYDKVKMEIDDGAARSGVSRGEALIAKRKYKDAATELQRVLDKWPNTPSGKKAQALMDKLNSDQNLSSDKKETEAAKKCRNWLQLARGLAKNGKTDEAKAYYEKIIKTYPGTSFAETAKAEMEKL